MKKLNWRLGLLSVVSLFVLVLAACQKEEQGGSEEVDSSVSVDELVERAKEEGEVHSVGMPDTWANWVETWEDLKNDYGIQHTDTDMSSAEELAKFEAEKNDATADIGDVGIAFGPIAKERGLTFPYKTSYWDDIPDWAKDEEGHWVVGYTGTISFLTDLHNVKDAPTSWEQLKQGDYRVSIGDALTANQAHFTILAAAYAFGGDETNIEPGIEFFATLAKEGRLGTSDPSVANLEKGEIDVAIVWDFNGLGYRNQIDEARFEVVIPEEASVMSGYATIINQYSKNKYAAMLAREHILSDKGQENLARGYARPIRDNVPLSDEVRALLLPEQMYANARPVNDQAAWEETTKQLPNLWQEKVLIHAN